MQDFVTALTPGNPGFGLTLATVLITFFLGFMVYVYSVVLVIHEDAGPYPVWMHAFYCAADFMGIWAFMSAYDAVGGFWFFVRVAVVGTDALERVDAASPCSINKFHGGAESMSSDIPAVQPPRLAEQIGGCLSCLFRLAINDARLLLDKHRL